MRLFKTLLASSFLVGGLALTGCGPADYVEVRGSASYTTPTLAWVGPGLWVVEDYHRPVFYTHGYYWLYDDGYWYRSYHHRGDWRRVRRTRVPRRIVGIERPRRYIHYEARRDVYRRRGPTRRYLRDHRERLRHDRRYDRQHRRYYDRDDRRRYYRDDRRRHNRDDRRRRDRRR